MNPLSSIELANALKVVRPELGPDAPIALFRIVRLIAFEEILGRGAGGTAYLAGKKLGQALAIKDLEDFLRLCNDLRIGKISVKTHGNDEMHVDVFECVTCSGLDPVGRPLCAFEGGLIAGVVQSITKRRVNAKEVSCIGGLGHDACGFDLTLL